MKSKQPQRRQRPYPTTPARRKSAPASVEEGTPAVTPQAAIQRLQRQQGNSYVQRLLAQREADKDEPPAAVGYVGLNLKAYKEARALERISPDLIISSLDNPQAQAALDTPQEWVDFIYGPLDISPLAFNRFFNAYLCLAQCDADFREQMGDMMRMFRDAEVGQYRLERLVLSGHHASGEMWGKPEGQNSPGSMMLERDLTNLSNAFPQAAAQVKDIMFSACNSKGQVEMVRRVFPNLRSAWVYGGYSPDIKQRSAEHIKKWERKTRGEKVPRKRDKVGNTAIWTSDKGFVTDLK